MFQDRKKQNSIKNQINQPTTTDNEKVLMLIENMIGDKARHCLRCSS